MRCIGKNFSEGRGKEVNHKNRYKVIKIINGEAIEHSNHINFEYAVIQRDQLRKKGFSAMVMYRGHIVEQDVKKIKPMKEGI